MQNTLPSTHGSIGSEFNATYRWDDVRRALARVMDQRKRLKSYEVRSFFISLGPTAGTLMLQLVTFVILGRGLGASDFGQYAALTAITSVLVEAIGCGGGDILVRGIILRPAQFPSTSAALCS